VAGAVGGGGWVAILEQPILGPMAPVWCFDATARPVAPELPDDWPRVPVDDADEPCPACGRREWDQVTATDDSRGMRSIRAGRGAVTAWGAPNAAVRYRGMEPTPFVVCRACGHEESIGGLARFAGGEAAEEAGQHRRHHQALRDLHESQRESLRTLSFPVFADHGSRAVMCGSGGSEGRLDRVTVRHGGRLDESGPTVEIETSELESHRHTEYACARRALEHWLSSSSAELPHHRSDAGLIIAWRALDRERRRRAATAARSEILIRLGGRRERFTCLRAEERWVAVRHGTTQTLTISGSQADPAQLDLWPLRDPVGDLDWERLP
jgi:hypothetical protein